MQRLLPAALGLALGLWCPDAAAAWLWVGDTGAKAEVEVALAELWPGHPLEVRVGPREGVDTDGIALWLEGDELVLEMQGQVTRRAPAEDPWTQAALSRAWLRTVGLAALAPPRVALHGVAPGPEEGGKAAWAAWGQVALGPGSRYPETRPAVRLVAGSGVGTGGWRLGLTIDGETGEVLERDDAAAMRLARLGVGPVLALSTWVREDLAMGLSVRPGVRALLAWSVLDDDSESWLVPGVTAALELRRIGEGAAQPFGRLDLVVDDGRTAEESMARLGISDPARSLGLFVCLGADLGPTPGAAR